MIKLSKKQINCIAQDLDLGLMCYVDKITGEVRSIPPIDVSAGNLELRANELNEIEKNRDQYILIGQMGSSDSFKVMRRFLGKVADPNLRQKLMLAISQNKPFRRFRNILDYNGDVLQDWYQFKQEEMERYVEKHLRIFSSEEEE